jgi:hypothetical protein
MHDISILILLVIKPDARARCGSLVLQSKTTTLKQAYHLLKGEIFGRDLNRLTSFSFLFIDAKVAKFSNTTK